MKYSKLNNSIGWLVFLLATIVYFLTLEETASLWDCGEYITAAYKLEVGHPPGAPFFMLIGRIFSLFAMGDVTDVALWINRMSALSSSLTILFLFWSITLLSKKIYLKNSTSLSKAERIVVLGSGFVGAMAYTFTESFWFSAVEGEVYAMSSLFTAVIFWAALKWDEEMTKIKLGLLSNDTRPLRWMVLIMFLFGLAIGVHLLGLLVLPAIAYIVLYNMKSGKEVDVKTFLLTGVIGVFVLGFVQEGIIPGTIAIASKMEIFFKNSLGLPFMSGAILFFALLIALLIFGLIYTRKKNFVLANTVVLGLIMLFIGYGSFATIVIRSNANPPLDENNPENLVTLHAYLKREQYGSWPILYGEWFNSKTKDSREYGDRSPFYDKRYVVTTSSGNEIAAFREKEVADEYVKNHSNQKLTINHKYFETNKHTRKGQVVDYAQKTFFPRMFYKDDQNKINGYKSWSGYDPTRKVDRSKIGDDGLPLPSFGNNISYFINYQFNWMYWRYFMWNFTGRQNDIQGHGDAMRGNWLSGFEFVDEARLGAQGDNAPYFTSHNPSNNKFYFIPLILGLIGLFFHFVKAPRDAFVVFLVFLFTGLAIVVYLNQKPFEPRERDYAYAASFYAFAIWIGLGVMGLFEAYRSYSKQEFSKLAMVYGGVFTLALISDFFTDNSTYPILKAVIVIGVILFGALGLMYVLNKGKIKGEGAASIALGLGIIAPIILGVQGWDDHDRSNRYPAKALAWNYLQSCSPNAILYTNGDNDTFPLWYLQEVEGIRTDIRVANLSLMQTDWYTEQMMMRAYESDPLPIKFREDQILMGAGNTDIVLFIDYEVYSKQMNNPQLALDILKTKIEYNPKAFAQAIRQFRLGLASALNVLKVKDQSLEAVLPQIGAELRTPLENPSFEDYQRTEKIMRKVFGDINNGKLEGDRQVLNQLQEAATNWTKSWDYLPLDYAMEFVREDKNMLEQPGGRKLRFFPSRGFILPVNAENAVQAGVIDDADVTNCEEQIKFSFTKGRMFRNDVRALSREEVMMLDILANFDWERGIFFSSPGGSDLAKAFYGNGNVINVGQVYMLSPLKVERGNDVSLERMKHNIFNVFQYGNLNAEGVLVDYYVRRHTSQYRRDFLELAMGLTRKYEEQMSPMRGANDTLNVGSNDDKAQDLADEVEAVVRKCMDELPMSKVLDFGEPRAIGRGLQDLPSQQIYTDGSITELISVLYAVDKIDYANDLAMEYIAQLETMIDFFDNSSPLIAYNNQEDFIAFCMNFFRMFREVYSANDGEGLAEQVLIMNNRLTNDVVPNIVNGLSNLETNETKNGRSVKRKMNREADKFQALFDALLSENGL